MAAPTNLFTEYERTYVARRVPSEISGVTPQRITDVYFPEAAVRPPLRLRQRGNLFEITKKTPVNEDDYSVQSEQTIVLTADEFAALIPVSKRSVAKDRYAVQLGGHAAEVDLFVGELKGLVLIDFEFQSQEDKTEFVPPDCCLAEVTQDLFIAGGQLAGRTYQDIAGDLTRLGYKPLEY